MSTEKSYLQKNPDGTFVYENEAAWEAQTPMLFTMTAGNPLAKVSQADAGLYAEDDWRLKSNFTVSYGLRFETQNNVKNRANFAPRLGFAWGLGHGPAPKTVLRAGFGMFYDRFSRGNVLDINRTNSTDPQVNYQVQWTGAVTDPTKFNTVPNDLSTLGSGVNSIVYATDPRLKLPYTMQVAATLERQVSKSATMTVSYIGSRGLHQLVMEDLTNTNPGVNTYQYQAAGTFKQHQLMANTTVRAGQYLSLFGWYVLGYSNSNTSGGFPSALNNLADDWGRSSYDVRNRGMIGGSISLPHGFRFESVHHREFRKTVQYHDRNRHNL